jgi:deoxyribodipyrimidine photo-lyase
MTYSVVWLKRDLRLHDHAALAHAAARGDVLCLYVIEPRLWAQADAANQHYQFILESLRDLYAELRLLGGRLHVVTGEMPAVLDRLFALKPFTSVFSHEETGNWLSYQRDLQVGKWCRVHGVHWQEFAQFGVVRRLRDRDEWKARWDAHIEQAMIQAPDAPLRFVDLPWQEPPPPSLAKLGLDSFDPPQRQRGGRARGLAVLHSFLNERSHQYRGGISSPLSSPTACSRLSPYLAYGCLSLREIVHATNAHKASLPPSATRQKQGLNAFISRLYWHCHFIQKLESEPELEFRNLHRGYDGLRESDWNQAHFEALINARTGWPMVDACVTMLRETGWINFRMRAMLVSVAAYPLWLHWHPVGHWLARQFLDYEPGIHWSQMQMQSGTTGINIPRVYNPIKQAHDHDPRGIFVRRWLPAMRRVPDSWLFEPWRMPPDVQAHCGLKVGSGLDTDIPLPIIDLETATRAAKARLFAVRAEPKVKVEKAAIVKKHGSRNLGGRKSDAERERKESPKKIKTKADKNSQLSWDF